ncbi:MFS transporter [Demequina aestuarii]|uniref:MFS transporter n=1 Tax=Demequina aestuarii TaxID=327095 RepID=UPI000782EF47|nr:MFS transporter [Demequina aestuarii]
MTSAARHGPSARGIRSVGFWLIVVAASANYSVNAAAAPLLTRGTLEVLGQDAAAAGGLVAITGITAIVAMAAAGVAADRVGPKTVAVAASVLAIAGVGLLIVSFTVPSIAVSRLAYGAGNAGVTIATTSWVALSTPHHQRGRALGYYGISVWVGLAAGPLLAENLYAWAGNSAAWAGMAILQVMALGIAALVASTPTVHPADARKESGPASPESLTAAALRRSLARAVWVPAVISLAAWGAQGLLTAFLVLHLQAQGMPASGVGGAATIFVVFAASVVVARIALGAATDRIAVTSTARASLAVVAAGLSVIAFAPTFWWAAAGAAVLGVGYAPLYPTLTLMATAPLPPARQSTAIGFFSAATALGMAVGPALGGLSITATSSTVAFVGAAVVQLAVIPVVRFSAPARETAPQATRA